MKDGFRDDSAGFYLQVPRDRIAYITKIIEAAGHLAVVTTLDKEAGLLRVLCDAASVSEVSQMLESLDCGIVLPDCGNDGNLYNTNNSRNDF